MCKAAFRGILTRVALIASAVSLGACVGSADPGGSSGGQGGGGGGGGAGAGGDGTPATLEEILWDEIRLEEATDLGFVPEAIPAGEQTAAGDILLAEVGVQAGLGESTSGGNPHGVGVGFFDADGDGLEDIFLVGGAENGSFLYRNEGDGTFADVTEASNVGGLLGGVDGYSVAAGDYDTDGDLDVYVGAHPNDRLLQNQGDGTFIDVTEESGFAAAPTGNPCAVMWSDFDNDGDQDLWIWNDRGSATENRALLRNDGGAFTDITEEARITEYVHGNPMGIDGADVDHDGHLDYYVSDIGGNAFLHNTGDGAFTDLVDVAGAAGDYGWGLAFEDFNADGWADIFVAQEDDRDYLTFTNLGMELPRFSEQRWPHAEIGNGHNVAAAFADYDDDGDVDVVTAGTSGARMNLYRNDTDRGTNRWLEVRVPETPRTGELGGISGRVVVKTGDLLQFRDLTGGSSRASQNAMSVRFGLGQWTGAEWVAVLWPDGRQVVVTGVEGNRVLEMPGPS